MGARAARGLADAHSARCSSYRFRDPREVLTCPRAFHADLLGILHPSRKFCVSRIRNVDVGSVACPRMGPAGQRVSHHWMGGDATTSHQSRQHEPRLISTLSEAFGGLTGHVAVRHQSLMYTCTVRSCSRTLPRSACHSARHPTHRPARRPLPRSLAL